MSERKVLNKYYPPDFDPTKIPRSKAGRNKQFTVRLMAPCNMRCNTCGEYIYKGKKFNARKEDVDNQDYLGLRIYRFYIKCTRCIADICFKTDPESCDYIIEAGATRNFMALKLAEEQAEREEAAEREDEATNPMKVLEKRTQASRHEMAVLEALEELKELNQRQITPDQLHQKILGVGSAEAEEAEVLAALRAKREEAEDEAFVQSVFGGSEAAGSSSGSSGIIRRIEDESSDSSDDEKAGGSKKSNAKKFKPSVSDFLVDHLAPSAWKPKEKQQQLGMLVKPKAKVIPATVTSETVTSTSTKAPGPKDSMDKKASEPKATTGLSLLGSYSSSSGSESE